MGKATLVATDLTIAAELVRALDIAGLAVSCALWLVLPEYEDWRFVISGRKFDELTLSAAYSMVRQALEAAGISLERTPSLMILKMSDPLIRGLRRLWGRVESAEGRRIGGHSIGDRFIEDGFAFRIR